MATVLSSSGVKAENVQMGNEKDAGGVMPPPKSEEAVKPDQQLAFRPAPLIWFFVCVGLYLGALLYGKKSLALSLPIHVKRSQVSTQP